MRSQVIAFFVLGLSSSRSVIPVEVKIKNFIKKPVKSLLSFWIVTFLSYVGVI